MSSQETPINAQKPSDHGATDEVKSQPNQGGRRVVVLGSTGAIGSRLVLYLAAQPDTREVVALTRRAGVFEGVDKVTEHIITTDGPMDFKGDVDAAFCAIGTTKKKTPDLEEYRKIDYGLPVKFAQRVKELGAKEFHLVTSVGADPESSTFYLRTKGETEDAVRALNFDYLMVYRPGILYAEYGRPETRCGEDCAVCCFKYFLCCCKCGRCDDFQVISVDDVARVMTYISSQRAAAKSAPAGSVPSAPPAFASLTFSVEDGSNILEGSGKMLAISELPGVPEPIKS